LPELPDDDRYASNARRVEHRDELSRKIVAASKSWRRDELLAALEQAGVPAGPINSVEQAFRDPQTRVREMQLLLKRAADGAEIPGIRTPIRFGESTLSLDQPSPLLGADAPQWR
jgi:crotonobetainyl-CoA:carnitine CoA-transferase CaiB-like acyl-CoA transferase